MKQVFIRGGQAVVDEVPAPGVDAGSVLVAVESSCISTGTEVSGLRNSGEPLWKRAIEHPDMVQQVVRMAMDQGARRIYSMVRDKVSSGTVVGYSAAGRVIAVGEGVDDVRVGDRVACAGAQAAHHAEVIRVPRNLVAPVPDGVELRAAATATLGAIAMQGVRRCQVTLGETVVVLGLGALGLLTVQLVNAAGGRVVAVDLDRDRVRLARELGAHEAFHPDDEEAIERVHRMTDGYGADAVIVTAASRSDRVMSDAFRMCRRRGRVVLVGDVGLNLNREDFYRKEIDFLISTSYGPGRYDPSYEEGGIDYPIAYVRWTENRNLGEYLRLIRDGRLRVEPMITSTTPVADAGAAYAALAEGTGDLLCLLEYPGADAGAPAGRIERGGGAAARADGRVRLGVIGAGSFARGMHLPNARAMPDLFALRVVMGRSGHNVASIGEQFGAEVVTTSMADVLEDAATDAVLITSRHHLHAESVLAALRAGKHVYVEKPLALTGEEVDAIEAHFSENPSAPLLMTGFNRRFSPHVRAVAEAVASRTNPMIINYRMNAGHLPADHWTHGPEGGGRNLGEACHIYDLFTCLTGERVREVSATAIRPATRYYGTTENFVATMSFADGSVASLTYTAMGSKEHPKESMEVYVDGKVIVLGDYRSVEFVGSRRKGTRTRLVEKGHREALAAFGAAIRDGGAWPIPLWQQVQATRIALEVEEQLRGPRSA